MNRLSDKVAIITGSATGIGRATAVLFVENGAKVAVVDLNEKGNQETVEIVKRKGGDAISILVDVTKAGDVQRMVNTVLEKYGKIDILHNNAGILGKIGFLHEVSEEEWDKIMAVNLKGYFLCSKYVIPEMIKKGGGVIINTASLCAHVGWAKAPGYTASKGAVLALTRTMAIDYAPYNIRVNCISPGSILTPMLEQFVKTSPDPEKTEREGREAHILKRRGKPEEVAYAVLFLASDESSFVTGACFRVDGGYTAW